MTDPAAAARRCVEHEHADLLSTLAAAADAVADGWDDEVATDGATVSDELAAAMRAGDAYERLPGVLADAVAATGHRLRADPVAAPPYVAVTSRGPVLRGTVESGRLVLTLGVFAVEREPSVRYIREPPGGVSVDAEFVPAVDEA